MFPSPALHQRNIVIRILKLEEARWIYPYTVLVNPIDTLSTCFQSWAQTCFGVGELVICYFMQNIEIVIMGKTEYVLRVLYLVDSALLFYF